MASLSLQFYLVLVWGLICVALAGVTWLPVLAGLWAPLSWTGAPPLAPSSPVHPERVVMAVPSLQHASVPVRLVPQHNAHGLAHPDSLGAAPGHAPATASRLHALSFVELAPAAARSQPHAPHYSASVAGTAVSVPTQRLRGTLHSVATPSHSGIGGMHAASAAATAAAAGMVHSSAVHAHASPHAVTMAAAQVARHGAAVPAHLPQAAHTKLPARFVAGRDVTHAASASSNGAHPAAHLPPVVAAVAPAQHGSSHRVAAPAAAMTAPAARQLPARMPSDQDIAVASDVANYEFTFASLDVGVMVSAIMMVSAIRAHPRCCCAMPTCMRSCL